MKIDSNYYVIPPWIDKDIEWSTVIELQNHGCDTGIYMPAVTYHEALATINQYHREIFDFLDDYLDEIELPTGSWPTIAVYILSIAVELWAERLWDEMSEEERQNIKQKEGY